MQIVDVLRHDSAAFALALPLSELEVRGVRLSVQREHLCTVETVKFLGFGEEKRVAQDGFRRILVLLIVQTVHRAEIRNAAFGRDARTAEKYDVVAVIDPVLELCNLRSQNENLLKSVA